MPRFFVLSARKLKCNDLVLRSQRILVQVRRVEPSGNLNGNRRIKVCKILRNAKATKTWPCFTKQNRQRAEDGCFSRSIRAHESSETAERNIDVHQRTEVLN